MSDTKISPLAAPDRPDEIYLLDTDVLALIENRLDAVQIYQGLIAMARSNRVRTVRQVFDELKRFESVHSLLSPHRDIFLIEATEQYDSQVQDLIEILGNEAPKLWEQTGSRNPDPADPWLVAVAGKGRYTLVTNENQRSPHKIPAACKLPSINCRCISGPHFLVEVQLVTTIDASMIDTASFFEKPKPK